jgi:hypothetical protein
MHRSRCYNKAVGFFQRRAHEVVELRQSLKSKEKLKEDLTVIQQKVEEHLKVFIFVYPISLTN